MKAGAVETFAGSARKSVGGGGVPLGYHRPDLLSIIHLWEGQKGEMIFCAARPSWGVYFTQKVIVHLTPRSGPVGRFAPTLLGFYRGW